MKRLIATIVFFTFAPIVYGDSITYEIYSHMESSDGRLVGKGTKEYSLSDIEVIEKEYKGEIHWAKALELAGGFRVGASIYRESQISGFGLWAKSSPCSFSWEWFNASGPEAFKKLQEGGSISVKYHETGELREIVTIHFDTDISLRINETRKEIGGVTHRILVKKGSVLKFSPNNAFQQTAALSRPCR